MKIQFTVDSFQAFGEGFTRMNNENLVLRILREVRKLQFDIRTIRVTPRADVLGYIVEIDYGY